LLTVGMDGPQGPHSRLGCPRRVTIYSNHMDKTTLYLDSDDYRKLKRIAATRKRAPAALVREAVAEYVARQGQTCLPKSVGAFASGRHDVSERAEELLAGMGQTNAQRPRRDRR
jgi:predicted transcriptional regulator